MDEQLASVRAQLIALARNKRTRVVGAGLPCRWWPWQVLSPESQIPFTEPGAWRFIVELLCAGQEISSCELREPPGALGYEMFVDLRPGERQLYIKLQLGRGRVIGRSFHYSERTITPRA